MARIFTTRFNFNHKLYDAIITSIQSDGKKGFHIRLLDTELYDLIPNGQFDYDERDGFKNGELKDNHLAQALMNSVAASIDQHLTVTS
jgi:hypothetical protein